jgi:hypothetical protein
MKSTLHLGLCALGLGFATLSVAESATAADWKNTLLGKASHIAGATNGLSPIMGQVRTDKRTIDGYDFTSKSWFYWRTWIRDVTSLDYGRDSELRIYITDSTGNIFRSNGADWEQYSSTGSFVKVVAGTGSNVVFALDYNGRVWGRTTGSWVQLTAPEPMRNIGIEDEGSLEDPSRLFGTSRDGARTYQVSMYQFAPSKTWTRVTAPCTTALSSGPSMESSDCGNGLQSYSEATNAFMTPYYTHTYGPVTELVNIRISDVFKVPRVWMSSGGSVFRLDATP